MSKNPNEITLTYQGLVDISYMVKGRVVSFKKHNEGLNAMFKFVAKILAGDLSTATQDAPAYLDIRYEWSDGTEQKSESVLYSTLSISDPSYFFDSTLMKWMTRFKIVLSYNMINFNYIETQVPNGAVAVLYLQSSRGEDFARLELEEDDIKLTDIVPGTQALIQWTLLLENKKELAEVQ